MKYILLEKESPIGFFVKVKIRQFSEDQKNEAQFSC